MKLRLLPNYFKKIGLTLFILTVWPSFIRGYIDGYNDAAGKIEIVPPGEFTFWGITFFSDSFYEVLAIFSLIGLIIYALSRDKAIDEYLLKLRMEAMHFTFFISMILVLALLLFGIKSEMNALYVLELQVIIFLIAKKIKKFSAKPDVPEHYEQ
jgi:hypothetical protein